MGKRGLYTPLGTRRSDAAVKIRMQILAHCDGRNSLLDIAEILNLSVSDIVPFVEELAKHDLIRPDAA